MQRDIPSKDLRTYAYVLKRTNYSEADRILNLITPKGKISAIAKGVRKEKSKLAGGVEMFSLIDINIHQGKGELGVITSAKMIKFFDRILKDYDIMECAAMILKKVSLASEHSDNPEFFNIVDQTIKALNDGIKKELVEIWFLFNLAKASGEEVNIYRDVAGEKLEAGKKYIWDYTEMALTENERGIISTDEIKTMRLILTAKLSIINKIKGVEKMIPELLKIAYAINKM